MINDFTSVVLAVKRLLGREAQASLATELGVVIGETNDGTPVIWPAPSPVRASHATVLAASGAGKTVLTTLALLGEITGDSVKPKEKRQATLVVDPKGDLVATLLAALAADAPERLSDVIYLDPFSEGAFPFNLRILPLGKTPTDVRAMQLAELVNQVSTAQGSQAHLGTGARQLDVLTNVILGALDSSSPEATILFALDALVEKGGLKTLASLTLSVRARQFLESAVLSDELKASCASRLRLAFGATAALERIVTAGSCLKFDELLSPGRIVLVHLGNPTGGLTALSTLWANLLVRLAIEHLMERPSPWKGHHCRVVVDEAQVVAGVLADVAERVLTTGRSRGVSLTVLSQGTTLIAKESDTLLPVLLTNASTRLIGRLSARDAELLAREISPGKGIDESLGEVRARFTAAVTNLADRDFFLLHPGSRTRFTTRTADLDAWQRAEKAEAKLITDVKTRFALPKAQAPRVLLSVVTAPVKDKGPSGKAGSRAIAKARESATATSRPSPARSRWG